MAVEIVDFPSYKMVDLSIAMLNYQRVNPINIPLNPIKSQFSYVFPMVSQWSFS